MEGKELSQSTMVQALSLMSQLKVGEAEAHLISAQHQPAGVTAPIGPSRLMQNISSGPKANPVQGRGRGRGLQQQLGGVNRSNFHSGLVKDLEWSEKQDCTKTLVSTRNLRSHFAQSQRETEIVPSTNVSHLALKDFLKEPIPQPRGRGRGIQRVLQTVNDSDATKITKSEQPVSSKKFSPDLTPRQSKTVVCNAAPFTPSTIFEYTVYFQPCTLSEDSRIGFLNKHFFKLDRTFLYNQGFVFVPRPIEQEQLKGTLFNRATASRFTMTLKFRQKLNLGENPALLHMLFKQASGPTRESLRVPGSQIKIIFDYVIAMRETESGTIMCLDHQYYLIQTMNFAEMMSQLEVRFSERFHEAVGVLLTKKPIFHTQDNKIYKMVKVLWTTGMLELERNGHTNVAKPEDCHVAEITNDISPYQSQTPNNIMSDLKELLSSNLLKNDWNLCFGNFTKAKARVLQPEAIIFGDGVQCTPNNGKWEVKMRENEVYVPTELWCWMILYTPMNKDCAEMLSRNIQRVGDDMGVSIGKPLFFEIKSDTKNGYVNALTDVICKELQLIVVIIPDSPNQPDSLIKHICCIPKPIPVQIVHCSDVTDPLKIHEITLQLNLMLGGVPWTVSLPYQNWMVCGIDLHCSFDDRTLPVSSFVTALTNNATEWYSKAIFVEDDFMECFRTWLKGSLRRYKDTNGFFPSQLLLYQNCTKATRGEFCNGYKGFNFEECLKKLQIKDMEICIILVQRDTNLSFYKDLKSGADNVPPGTVVDNAITSPNTSDFFLTSHYASNCTTARPTYYEVIKNTCGLASEQLELITYKMCHLFYKEVKIAEAPAPCLYAQKLGILVAEDICEIPSPNLDECLYYL